MTNKILNRFGVLLSVPETVHGSPAFSGATLWARRLHQTRYYFDQLDNVEGEILESGVHWGYGILLELTMSQDRKIYGFDSFAGHSRARNEDFSGGDFRPLDKSFRVSEEDVWKTLEYGTGLKKCDLSARVHLISGWIQETLPRFKEWAIRENVRLAFVHSDMDIYEPFKCTLENSWDLLSKNGIVLLGQLNDPQLMGKTIALNEFLATLESGSYELKSRFVIVNGLKRVEESWLVKL
jgi:hypothetical protein